MSESRGLWFLAGLTVGVLAGVLYAPQAGEQTRGMLREKAGEGRDKVKNKTEEWRQQAGTWRNQAAGVATDIADRGKSAVTRQIDQFQAAVEAGKQAYREASGLEDKREPGPPL